MKCAAPELGKLEAQPHPKLHLAAFVESPHVNRFLGVAAPAANVEGSASGPMVESWISQVKSITESSE
jgi:hypothetical protein